MNKHIEDLNTESEKAEQKSLKHSITSQSKRFKTAKDVPKKPELQEGFKNSLMKNK